MSEVERYWIEPSRLTKEGWHQDDTCVVKDWAYDRVVAEREGLQVSLNTADQSIDELNAAISRRTQRVRELEALLTAADERADVLENALRELLSGTGRSPGANKKYGKARAVLEGLGKKEDSRICTPAKPHNYHLGECTKCGAISPTE